MAQDSVGGHSDDGQGPAFKLSTEVAASSDKEDAADDTIGTGDLTDVEAYA
jgi:hypothetical protein